MLLSKSSVRATVPRVRIPPSPPIKQVDLVSAFLIVESGFDPSANLLEQSRDEEVGCRASLAEVYFENEVRKHDVIPLSDKITN